MIRKISEAATPFTSNNPGTQKHACGVSSISVCFTSRYTVTKFQLHQISRITKQDKLLAKLLKIPPPKDMTWDELELCFK